MGRRRHPRWRRMCSAPAGCGVRLVGAEIPILGTNAYWDNEGEYFVAEGDESDGTIALYHPEHTILLNIEEENMDFYENLAAIEAVYSQLLDQTSGNIFYCVDDAHTARVCKGRPNAISYGETDSAEFRFQTVLSRSFRSKFKVFWREQWLGGSSPDVPGAL